MPKTFYTEHDIEDMVARGQQTLTVGEGVVLTDLAFEMANRLNLKLLQPNQKPPAAPERPYLSEEAAGKPAAKPAPQSVDASNEALRDRIRKAVKAKLGNEVDAVLLETIITRVLNNVGVK